MSKDFKLLKLMSCLENVNYKYLVINQVLTIIHLRITTKTSIMSKFLFPWHYRLFLLKKINSLICNFKVPNISDFLTKTTLIVED